MNNIIRKYEIKLTCIYIVLCKMNSVIVNSVAV